MPTQSIRVQDALLKFADALCKYAEATRTMTNAANRARQNALAISRTANQMQGTFRV